MFQTIMTMIYNQMQWLNVTLQIWPLEKEACVTEDLHFKLSLIKEN